MPNEGRLQQLRRRRWALPPGHAQLRHARRWLQAGRAPQRRRGRGCPQSRGQNRKGEEVCLLLPCPARPPVSEDARDLRCFGALALLWADSRAWPLACGAWPAKPRRICCPFVAKTFTAGAGGGAGITPGTPLTLRTMRRATGARGRRPAALPGQLVPQEPTWWPLAGKTFPLPLLRPQTQR